MSNDTLAMLMSIGIALAFGGAMAMNVSMRRSVEVGAVVAMLAGMSLFVAAVLAILA